MTENKRYIDDGFEAIEDQSFTDTETDKTYYVDYFDEIVDLLNEQDKTIKELEKDLNDALNRIEERSIDVQLLKEENGNLKKENELKGDFRNFINEDIVQIKKENEQLKQENKELREDNDIKFWKLQCMRQHNSTQVILHEVSLAIKKGYEVSDEFKKYIGDLEENNKKMIEKNKRLFGDSE